MSKAYLIMTYTKYPDDIAVYEYNLDKSSSSIDLKINPTNIIGELYTDKGLKAQSTLKDNGSSVSINLDGHKIKLDYVELEALFLLLDQYKYHCDLGDIKITKLVEE
jgi:hypothetical protein